MHLLVTVQLPVTVHMGGADQYRFTSGLSARIVSSRQIGECVVHEMDDFAHPKVLDRYFDQLRIPGSS